MKLKQVYEFRKDIVNEGIIICYSGPISQGVIEEMAEAIKKRVDVMEQHYISERVFSIFIEQVQNVMRYSAETELDINKKDVKMGLTIIGKENDKFYSIAGNLINNDRIDSLVEKLEKIKKMDKAELKAYYKEQMKKESPEDSVGAGLGFIDMARKASGVLDYFIEKVDEKQSFFSLKIEI